MFDKLTFSRADISKMHIKNKGREMREITTKIMKSIFRIAICSIGGLLTIFGLIFCLYFLVHLPDSLSKDLHYFLFAIVILSVGLSLCFLSIKPMCNVIKFRNFVKSHKMPKEEKAINNIKKYMRQRKIRIAVFTILLVFMIATSICMISIGNKLTRTMTPEKIRLLAAANLMSFHYLLALFTGFIIGTLIIEISGHKRNKHMLTLNMWERIQQLENEVKELKTGTQAESQQISDVDGGDTASDM